MAGGVPSLSKLKDMHVVAHWKVVCKLFITYKVIQEIPVQADKLGLKCCIKKQIQFILGQLIISVLKKWH